MNHVLTFAFIGGDLRQIQVIRRLSAMGHEVRTFGLENACNAEKKDSLSACLSGADIVVLPLPYNIGETINVSLSKEVILTNDVIESMSEHQLLLAGKCDNYLHALAELHHIRLFDYMDREELSVLNTIPTVEGALSIAMTETPFTIHGSQCLVLGYGRIGKLLSKALQSLGATVHVAARKHSDLAWIKANAMTAIPMKHFSEGLGQYDLIFNTAPVMLLGFKQLSLISDDCLIIDLASKPGGVDFQTAQELGKKVIWALSLPGKVAPDTAGDIIKDTIINILEELEV